MLILSSCPSFCRDTGYIAEKCVSRPQMCHYACFHVRDTGFLFKKCVSCKGITRFMQFSFSDTHYNSVFGVSRTKNKKRTPEASADR